MHMRFGEDQVRALAEAPGGIVCEPDILQVPEGQPSSARSSTGVMPVTKVRPNGQSYASKFI